MCLSGIIFFTGRQKKPSKTGTAMLVFQLITSIDLGGAENVAFSLCALNKQERPGYKLVLFEIQKTSSAYARDKKEKLREAGIEYYSLGVHNKYLSLVIAPIVLFYHIIRKKPSIVHSHTDLPDFVLAVALKLFFRHKFKIVRTIHNTELWPTHATLGRIAESSFKDDTVIAVSESALAAYVKLRTRYNLKPSIHQQVIFNGVKAPEKQEHPFRIDRNKINIAFAGRLELQKGVDIFIELVNKLSSRQSEAIAFHIIGDGMYKQAVTTLCSKYSCCRYYGVVSDLANKLVDFDYLMMPSRFEGLGLLSVEASMSGVPVIASKSPGLSETLPDEWPLWVDPLTAEGFLNILDNILDGKYDCKQLREQAYNYTREKFSSENMEKNYRDAYRDLFVNYQMRKI